MRSNGLLLAVILVLAAAAAFGALRRYVFSELGASGASRALLDRSYSIGGNRNGAASSGGSAFRDGPSGPPPVPERAKRGPSPTGRPRDNAREAPEDHSTAGSSALLLGDKEQEYYKEMAQRKKIFKAPYSKVELFNADWYFLDAMQLTMYPYTIYIKDEEGDPVPGEDYREYMRGCIGLCTLRLGLPKGGVPYKSAEKCFTEFSDAYEYAKGLTSKDGKKVRIFAILFDNLTFMTEEEWKMTSGEIPKDKVDIGKMPYDYLTLHQTGSEENEWYWESMTRAYTAEADRAKRPGQVKYRPFRWVMRKHVVEKCNYAHVLFCVVYATNKSGLLPRAVTYGK